MISEFRKFIMRGNVLDLAVGIIIGAAFTGIVNSLVNDIIMPPIGYALGGVDFSNIFILLKPGAEVAGPYASLADAQAAGAVTINIGIFLNAIINFLIVAIFIFLLVRAVNRMTQPITRRVEKPGEPVNKECPFCVTSIPYKATRCPNCTSEIPAQASA
jgi:large conductance mechanosensitive channel